MRRLAIWLALMCVAAPSLRAQAEGVAARDSLRPLPTVRYALDCTDTGGNPARIPAGYDGAVSPLDVDELPRLARPGRARRPKDVSGPGAVRFLFVVDTTGRIEPCTISAEQVSDVRFVPAALEIVAASRYIPATLNGRKVRVVVTQRVSFD